MKPATTVFARRRLGGLAVMTAVLLISAGAEVPGLVQSAFTGKVVAVLDGDSLMVLDGRQQVEVRLHGVDAPERGQAFGSVCRRTLSNLAFGKTAAVQVMDIDRYKRSVSRVTVDGRDVGLEMIRAGCAWHYRQYANDATAAHTARERRSHGQQWEPRVTFAELVRLLEARGLSPPAAGSGPVLPAQSSDSLELPHVRGDQRGPQASRLAREQHVVGADRLPGGLELSPD